jgi:lysophospholipase L1-like esterase
MSSFGQAAYPASSPGRLSQRARERWPAVMLLSVLAALLAAGLVLLGIALGGSGQSASQTREFAAARSEVRALSAQLAQAQRTRTTTAQALTASRSRLLAQTVALAHAHRQLAAARTCEHARRPQRCVIRTLGRRHG